MIQPGNGQQPLYPDIRLSPEFELSDLVVWLETAQARWGFDGARITGRLERTGINIYQDGTYRAAIDLDDERPCLSSWADEDA